MIAIVQVLHPDVGYVTQWRQALRVVGGETRAAAQVRVQDRLPLDLVGFTGRATELDHLRRALHHGQQDGGAVVISAIVGMAGVARSSIRTAITSARDRSSCAATAGGRQWRARRIGVAEPAPAMPASSEWTPPSLAAPYPLIGGCQETARTSYSRVILRLGSRSVCSREPGGAWSPFR
jgi:hypothetical protein